MKFDASSKAFSTVTAAGVVALRSAPGAAELTKAEREAMLADVRGNAGSTARLTIVANTYIQGAKPGEHVNSHAVRIRDLGLRATARSFRNTPFLRDHNAYELAARGGTVVECEVVVLEDGAKALQQTIELTKPWAIEAALDGTLDRFSVSYALSGTASCTICGKPAKMGWFSLYPTCDHVPGRSYSVESGGSGVGSQVAELEFENAVGKECSGVSMPAVDGTSIEEVRQALTAGGAGALAKLAAELGADPKDLARELGLTKETPMKFALIAAALALAADSDETAVVAAIEKLKLERDGAKAAAKDASDQLAASTKQLTELREAGKKERVTALLAAGIAEGKYLPNGKVEAHLKKLAEKGDEEGIAAYLGDIEPGAAAPIGVARQSAGKDPVPRGLLALTDEDRAAARRAGKTDEEFLALKREAFPHLAAE